MDLPAGTITLVFTDIVESSELSERFGAERPSRSLFQYWNSVIDPFCFMLAAPRILSSGVPSGNRKGALR